MMDYERKSMGERLCQNKDFYIPSNTKKKQSIKDKQVKNKLKKIKINRIHTIIIASLVLLAIFFAIFVIIKVSNKPKIILTDSTIFTTLNVDEYSSDILAMYNREGQVDLFKTEMDRIQSLIGNYLIENMTINQEDTKKLIKNVQKELSSKTWGEILSQKSTYYVGQYKVEENGNLKFKFASKSIEPSWVKDEKVAKYIILN